MLAQGIGGGKLLAPVPVPYVPVVSEVFLGPTQWEGVGAAPEMVHKVTQPPTTNDNLCNSTVTVTMTMTTVTTTATSTDLSGCAGVCGAWCMSRGVGCSVRVTAWWALSST